MVAEAQQKKAGILEELGRERGLLERKIEELRGFERDYRSRLHTYIQGQLADLQNTGVDSEPDHEQQRGGGRRAAARAPGLTPAPTKGPATCRALRRASGTTSSRAAFVTQCVSPLRRGGAGRILAPPVGRWGPPHTLEAGSHGCQPGVVRGQAGCGDGAQSRRLAGVGGQGRDARRLHDEGDQGCAGEARPPTEEGRTGQEGADDQGGAGQEGADDARLRLPRRPATKAPATKAAPAKKAPATQGCAREEGRRPTKAAPAKKAPATKAAPAKKARGDQGCAREEGCDDEGCAREEGCDDEGCAGQEGCAATKAAPAKKAATTKAAPAKKAATHEGCDDEGCAGQEGAGDHDNCLRQRPPPTKAAATKAAPAARPTKAAPPARPRLPGRQPP